MTGMMKKLMASLFSATLVFSCFADENDFGGDAPAPFPQAEGRQNRNRNRNRNREGGRGGFNREGGRGGFNREGGRGGFNRGNMMQMGQWMQLAQRVLAFETIREKFPQESAELDKVLIETENKYAELAKKAEITVPASLEINLLKLRAADTAAYTETLKAIKENPRQNFNKLLELAKKHNIELFPARRMPMAEGRNIEAPSRSRDNSMRPNFSKLRKEFPEEIKQYMELRSTDPAKAKEFLQGLMKRSEEAKNKK